MPGGGPRPPKPAPPVPAGAGGSGLPRSQVSASMPTGSGTRRAPPGGGGPRPARMPGGPPGMPAGAPGGWRPDSQRSSPPPPRSRGRAAVAAAPPAPALGPPGFCVCESALQVPSSMPSGGAMQRSRCSKSHSFV
jgi:hypothetical protein